MCVNKIIHGDINVIINVNKIVLHPIEEYLSFMKEQRCKTGHNHALYIVKMAEAELIFFT